MVQHAREPQHQPAADASASNLLPYDPEEWKQRVAAARTSEEVLRQRAEEQQRMAGERQPVGPFERADLPIMVPTPSVPALLNTSAGKQPKAVGVIPYFSNMRPSLCFLGADEEGKTPFGGPVPPMLLGLVIGVLAGASLVIFGATHPSGIDPQSESAPPVSSAGPFMDAAPSYATPVRAPPLGTWSSGLGVVPFRCTRLPLHHLMCCLPRHLVDWSCLP